MAKLLRIEQILDRKPLYVYECEVCHEKECTYSNRMNKRRVVCLKCQREESNIKQQERIKAREREIYNKAIDEYKTKIRNRLLMLECMEDAIEIVDQIAEQLKENENDD